MVSTSLPAGAPPAFALRLGYAGLLPFFLGAALVWLVHDELRPHVLAGLSAYAAVIVSFLGGIHWGAAFQRSETGHGAYVWGVVPSLVAWVAVMMPPDAGLVIHGAMLVVCYLVDRRHYPPAGLGAWLTLRFRLSSLAALSCFLGAAGA